MKSIVKSNTFCGEKRKITLRSYYTELPEAQNPRKDLIDEVCKRCNVPYTTARSWFLYNIRPSKPENIVKLSEITGISPEDMWED